MSKSSKAIEWTLSNTCLWALGIAATFYGHAWAFRIFTFLMCILTSAWVAILCTAKSNSNEYIGSFSSNPVPKAITISSDLLLACLVVGFGHWVVGTVIIVAMFAEIATKLLIEKIEEEVTRPEPLMRSS